MAGTDRTRTAITGGPTVILVRPQLGENIGAAARAMLNFGLERMRIVAPRDGWPNDKARAMASRADAVLDNARVFASTEEAVADCHVVLASSARRRDMVQPVLTPRRAAETARAAIEGGQRIGILFGGERAGLDNEDVARASALIHVPTNPAFGSLNLAQAVLLIAYEWFQIGAGAPGERLPSESPPATAAELANFMARLEQGLDDGGFLKPPEKRPTMMRNIRNIFQRGRPTDQEVRTLHGILSALRRAGEEAER